jgi:hypothetical protein
VSEVIGSYSIEDRHARRYYTDYFDALFRTLPDHGVLVAQQYQAEHMARYELLASRQSQRRDIRVLGRTPDPDVITREWLGGSTVFTFRDEARMLHSYGFRFVPVALADANGRSLDMSPLPLFKVGRVDPAIVVRAGVATDVSAAAAEGQASVRWIATAGDELTIDIASAVPLAPHVASMDPPTNVDNQVDVSELSGRYRSRISLKTATPGPRLAGIAFGEVPASVTVRTRSGRAEFWPRALRETGFFDANIEPLHIQFGPIHEDLLGYGWYPPERANAFDFRWTSRTEADVLVPLARPLAFRVTVSVMPLLPPHEATATVRLKINDLDLGARTIAAGWSDSTWEVPSSFWKPGINHLVIVVPQVITPDAVGLGPDTRTLGVAVRQLTLAPAKDE